MLAVSEFDTDWEQVTSIARHYARFFGAESPDDLAQQAAIKLLRAARRGQVFNTSYIRSSVYSLWRDELRRVTKRNARLRFVSLEERTERGHES